MPFNFVWSASVNTLLSVALSTSVLISAAVWSAVALDSMPSSLVPSVCKSLPSTVPETMMLPVTSKFLLTAHLSPVATYWKVAVAPSIVSPAPFAAAASAAPDASSRFLSSTVSVVLLIVVVVPLTVKSPPTITAPVVVSAVRLVIDCPLSAVAISAPVWSAVALASIPSSFVPSAATSRPSTLPLTVISPVTLAPEFAVRAVNVPAAGVAAPIIVPSILPPLISTTSKISNAMALLTSARVIFLVMPALTSTIRNKSVSCVAEPEIAVSSDIFLSAIIYTLIMWFKTMNGCIRDTAWLCPTVDERPIVAAADAPPR